VRRIVVLALSATALAACGASAASTRTKPTRIDFGLRGGNFAPFQITIERTGRVRATGSIRPRHRRLSQAKTKSLSRIVRRDLPALKSRRCPGTNPDIASSFIRAAGRTVTVHGSCEPAFSRLLSSLERAVGWP
jgi:hypothetical protein